MEANNSFAHRVLASQEQFIAGQLTAPLPRAKKKPTRQGREV